ncbi:MAG: DNA polymerase III subunit alpha, partial [Lachnospiraceae bacterium]|nr:DNA polymerase III subunit alpha [Lachnospiraceae bacterium]
LAGTEVNKRTIEAFIKAGAFDGFKGNRHQFMEAYPSMLESAVREKKDNMAGQMSLFDMMDEEEGAGWKGDTLPDVEEYPEEIRLAYEKEALGIYLTGHPLAEYEELIRKHSNVKSVDFLLNPETNTIGVEEGKEVTIGGLLTSVRLRQTKKGDTMAIVIIEDTFGSVECIVWPRTYAACNKLLYDDSKVLLTGKVKADDEKDGQLMVDKVVPLNEVGGTLYIRFEDKEKYSGSFNDLERILRTSEGNDRVMIYLNKEKKQKSLPASQNVKADDDLMSQLISRFGDENVKYTV